LEPAAGMSFRAIYTYAWDIAEEGVHVFAERVRNLGLDTVTLAGSYHAGKFLRPQGRSGKVYFPEDGTVYFKNDPTHYGAIKPVPNSMLAHRDVLRDLTDNQNAQTNVWLVLLHNTLLGSRHPEATVTNAFGDHYIYNLCPSAPAARDYAIGLARDVTENYAVAGISLETPGFLPYTHGFHHEFALNAPNRWLDCLLGLCFCDHCLHGAAQAGIDAKRLRAQVAKDIGAFLETDLDFPPDMAEAFWIADMRSNGDLKSLLDWRCTVVTSLVGEIRKSVRRDVDVAVIPSVARPTSGAWYEGSDLAALAESAGIVEACFYEPGVDRIRADLFDVKRRLDGRGRLRGILRPAYPDLTKRSEILAAVRALAENGVNEIAFYNWGHLRSANIAWIGEAIRLLDRCS
jgi:hypothetical protein